jgi:putative membrane protein
MQGSTIALISTCCTTISAILMAIGWGMIRRGKVEEHRRLMITSVIFAALFFILYMYRTIFIGNTQFGGPASLLPLYTTFLTIHIALTTIAPILAIFTLFFAYKKRFDKHRKFGKWTAKIWFAGACTAILTYLLLFVIFPEGPTTNLFRAYWGF